MAPSVLKKSAHIAIKKNSVAGHYRVPHLHKKSASHSAYFVLRNRTSPTATISCWPAAKGAMFCLTQSIALLVDSSACSCVSNRLIVNAMSSPTCTPLYSIKPGTLLIIGTNSLSARRIISSNEPGCTLIRRIAAYIACLLSLVFTQGKCFFPVGMGEPLHPFCKRCGSPFSATHCQGQVLAGLPCHGKSTNLLQPAHIVLVTPELHELTISDTINPRFCPRHLLAGWGNALICQAPILPCLRPSRSPTSHHHIPFCNLKLNCKMVVGEGGAELGDELFD